MPWALVRTVDFHHRPGPVTPLLRNPGGLPFWTESKLFSTNPGLIFPHTHATPTFSPRPVPPTPNLRACVSQSVACGLQVRKSDGVCLKCSYPWWTSGLLKQNFWSRDLRTLHVKTSSFSNYYKHKRFGDTDVAILNKLFLEFNMHFISQFLCLALLFLSINLLSFLYWVPSIC